MSKHEKSWLFEKGFEAEIPKLLQGSQMGQTHVTITTFIHLTVKGNTLTKLHEYKNGLNSTIVQSNWFQQIWS